MSSNDKMDELGKLFEPYRNTSGLNYVQFQHNGRRKNVSLDSDEARAIVFSEYHKLYQQYPKRDFVTSFIEYLGGVGRFNGTMYDTHLRIAWYDERIYVDLANEAGEVVEISKAGYKVLGDAPSAIRFIRPASMMALPKPQAGGTFEMLFNLMNVKDEDTKKRLIIWILSVYNIFGPFLAIVFYGEPGSAKSTASWLFKMLIDPDGAPLRSMPSSERDLIVAALNTHLLFMDNNSYLDEDDSDVVCRLVTGGSFGTRRLYSNASEFLVQLIRPIGFNSIVEFFGFRSDLAERVLPIFCPPISSSSRKRMVVIKEEFKKIHPLVLGKIFETLSVCLREAHTVKLKDTSRMADLTHFVTAAEKHLGWRDGEVAQILLNTRSDADQLVLENCPYAKVVIALAQDGWTGSATELLEKLHAKCSEDQVRKRGFPSTAASLSGQLRRLAPAFRTVGVIVNCDGKTAGSGSSRFVTLGWDEVTDGRLESHIQGVDATTATMNAH